MRHHPKFFVVAIILILLGAFIPTFRPSYAVTYTDVSVSPNFEFSRHWWKIVYWNNRTFEALFWCSSASSSQSSFNLYIFELYPQNLTLKSLYQIQSFTTTAIKLSATSGYPSIITTAISSYQNYILLWIYNYFYSDTGINKHFLALYTFDFTSNTTTGFSANPIFSASDGSSYDITLSSPYHRLVLDVGNLEITGFVSYQSASSSPSYSHMKLLRFYAVVTSLSPLAVTASTNGPIDTGKTDFVPYEIATFQSGVTRYIGIWATNYYGYYTYDTSANSFSSLTLANKKMPNLLVESWQGSSNVYTFLPEYQFIPVSYNPSTNAMSYQLAGTYYIGFSGDSNKPYQSQFCSLLSSPSSDTSTVDTYYLFSNYKYFIGYWSGYALKYHGWKGVSAPYNPTVVGYDTLNRQYQVVSYTPMVSFPALAYITNVVEIQFLTTSTMRLYYYTQPRPTYTIPEVTSTSSAPATAYYTTTQALTSTDAQVGFLTNVIIPLVIVSIPSLLLALYLGTSGLIIGLLVGGGLLFYGGFAPFGLVFLIILGTVVLLWRGGGGGKSEEAK